MEIDMEKEILFDYIEYLEKMNSKDVIGLNYLYAANVNFLQKINGKVKKIETQDLNVGSFPHTLNETGSNVFNERYDILAGKEAKEKDEIVIEVDSKNRIPMNLLEMLGIESKENINLEDLLNREVVVAFNDDYYEKVGNYFIPKSDLEKLYKNEHNIKLKVVGVIRLKKDYPNIASNPGIYYTHALMKEVLSKNEKSKVVEAQKNANYNVLSGEKIDVNSKEGKDARDTILAYLGGDAVPYVIQIHPKDFNSKENITNYLDQYNEGKEENEKIVYIDQASLMSSLSGSIMDAITIVLIAFSSISLIVSSIMIGIIMYISVLERTKEIGILRSLGARKKDISRVFNAETFIIGVSSGLIGILISWFLLFPINSLLYNLTDLEGVAILNPIHAIILVTISVILTLIGGWLPAKMASKKDPVVALRTE